MAQILKVFWHILGIEFTKNADWSRNQAFCPVIIICHWITDLPAIYGHYKITGIAEPLNRKFQYYLYISSAQMECKLIISPKKGSRESSRFDLENTENKLKT